MTPQRIAFVAALFLLSIGCQNPASDNAAASGGQSPASGGPDPSPAGPGPIAPTFDYQINLSTSSLALLKRSVILSSGTSGDPARLEFDISPNNPDLNIEEINTTFAFVRADGTTVLATYPSPATGDQTAVVETLFGNTHKTRRVAFSLPHLLVGGTDLYHYAAWTQGFVKVRVTMGVEYFQTGPGIPPQFFTKTTDFVLVQDLPAIEGTGYLASFEVFPGKIQDSWQVTAQVTYPDGSNDTITPIQIADDVMFFPSVVGFRPSAGLEHWTVRLHAVDGSIGDVEWNIPEGFDINVPDFICSLTSGGEPEVSQ